jgi:hypothetical protein
LLLFTAYPQIIVSRQEAELFAVYYFETVGYYFLEG